MTDRLTALEDELSSLTDAELEKRWQDSGGEGEEADLIAGEAERRGCDL